MTVPEKKQMNVGVELLLKRMETHPEEFYTDNPYTVGHGTKWGNVIDRFERFLDEEDRIALTEGMNKLMQQKLTEKVLEGLVDPKHSNDGVTLNNIAHPNVTLGAGVTPARSSITLNNTNAVYSNATATLSASGNLTTNSLTLGKTTVDETALHQLLHMKAQMELEKQKTKKHQTLFGKLHNYLGVNK